MAVPTILLIELLDGLGAREADAALRLRAMRCAGVRARALAFEPETARDPAFNAKRIASRVAAERPSEVWVAGGDASWRALANELPSSLPRTWWPTLVPGIGDEPHAIDSTRVRIASAAGRPPSALELAPVKLLRDRAPVALWDGDFVLAPGPLHGAEGAGLLRAFADAAAERPELELVVLAEPDAELMARARALGVGWRVHCAGPAPRDAEHTWLATAAAVLLPASCPLSAGLVLRSLAAGAPVIVDPEAAGARALETWLGAHAMPPLRAPGEALEAALTHEPWVREACARGEALAAEHVPPALATRLATRRERDDGRAREAA